jgi:uncharacterized Fe-S cluster protein YjdI
MLFNDDHWYASGERVWARTNSIATKARDAVVSCARDGYCHAAECLRGLPRVFDPKTKPWA